MAYEVIMPKAGMAMETGTILSWLKRPGEHVEVGEALLEIESDKVSMEVEAETSGYLLSVLYQEGAVVPVTQTIAYLGEKDETPPQPSSEPEEPAAKEAPAATAPVPADNRENRTVLATPAARRLAREQDLSLESVPTDHPDGVRFARHVTAAAGDGPAATSASSLARRYAADHGVDPNQVAGSGAGGRVVARDVVNAASQRAQAGGTPVSGGTEVPIPRIRRIIAERMVESHSSIPTVTIAMKVDMDRLLTMRKQMKQDLERAPSVNDFIVKATALALRDNEPFRTHFAGDSLIVHDRCDIGIAVAAPDGLLVPVIREPDRLSLPQIAETSRRLADRARRGRLGPEEISDAVFSVSNLGMYGVEYFTAIINPPQSGILSVGEGAPELVRDGEDIRERTVARIAVTLDHRVTDGANGALFLGTVQDMIEHPYRLM